MALRRKSNRKPTKKDPVYYELISDEDEYKLEPVASSSDQESDRPKKRARANKPKATSGREKSTSQSDEKNILHTGSIVQHSLSLHKPTSITPLLPNLLDWFDSVKHVRKMPWRKDYDASLDADAKAQRAYEVLVSEIMLQQTQVSFSARREYVNT
jgi:A/G-specific adenine glycosylase